MSESNDQHQSTTAGRIGLILGPVLAAVLLLGRHVGLELDPDRPQINSMAAVAVLMAVWWMTEAIPLAATALVPLALLPLLDIMPSVKVAERYGHKLIFLFLGGFLIALAVERSGLHRRIALLIVRAIGDSPRRVVLGFMVATAVLSMWLSNTATTVMMLPIAADILTQAERRGGDVARHRRMGIALMLGIAYAASIGGIGTLIGTPTNVAFKAHWTLWMATHPAAPDVTFFGWMVLAVPFVAVMLAASWFLLAWWIYPVGSERFLGGRDVIAADLQQLGPMTKAERRMLVIFIATALLWMLRQPVAGWGWAPQLAAAGIITDAKQVGDETVAIAMAVMCFIVPSGNDSVGRMLDWSVARRLPWGILLLFGGGLALAGGMGQSKLDLYLGEQLAAGLRMLPEVGQVAATSAGMTALTELTSNVASLQMILPVLGGAAEKLAIDPLSLMIPATLAASCAFMLPVATPPNAIVFGSGRLEIRHMIKAGLWLNVVGVAVIVAVVMLARWWAGSW